MSYNGASLPWSPAAKVESARQLGNLATIDLCSCLAAEYEEFIEWWMKHDEAG
jgi:hypothetical protein